MDVHYLENDLKKWSEIVTDTVSTTQDAVEVNNRCRRELERVRLNREGERR
jgi:hypothetical protein